MITIVTMRMNSMMNLILIKMIIVTGWVYVYHPPDDQDDDQRTMMLIMAMVTIKR